MQISLNQKNVIISGGDSGALKRIELLIYTKSIVMIDHEILGPGSFER